MDPLLLLTQTKDATEKYFALKPSDLLKKYGKDKWSVKEILVHLADAEGVLQERIKRIIAEPKQVLWAFDQDLWCDNLDYKNFPIEISKHLFLSNRESIIFLASNYYSTHSNKEFVHSQTGLKTLKEEIDKVVLHNQEHINQIKIALMSDSYM